MSADAIMALADSGTPGPWRAEPHMARRDNTVIKGGGRDDTFIAHYVSDPTDATKIVAAVNALPKVAALVAAIDALPAMTVNEHHLATCDGVGCAHPLVDAVVAVGRAANELVAALGVDSE